MKKLLPLLALPGLVLAAQQPAKVPDTFHIDVIVFSHVNDSALSSQQWPVIPSTQLNWKNAQVVNFPAPPVLNSGSVNSGSFDSGMFSSGAFGSGSMDSGASNSGALATLPTTLTVANSGSTNSGSAATVFNQNLGSGSWILAKQEAALRAHPAYQIIEHYSWNAKIPKGKWIKPFFLYGGQAYDSDGSTSDTLPSDPNALNGSTLWQLQGLLRITQGTFFNVRMHWLMALPSSDVDSDNAYNVQNDLAYFKLDAQRRIRSKELDYFDSPLYGVLLEIVPIKKVSATS